MIKMENPILKSHETLLRSNRSLDDEKDFPFLFL